MTSTPNMPPAGAVQMKLADALKRAQTHFAKGEFDQAERFAAAIVGKHPRHMQAIQVLAAIAEKRGQREQAIQLLNSSLTGSSADAMPLMNLCRILRIAGRLDESRLAGERAVALGTLVDALADLADTYTALGDHVRARDLFERAIAKRPQFARAHMGLAQALLADGEFGPGWAEYEWRYKLPTTQDMLPKFKQAQWNGMRMSSSRLLIIAEQGFGDCFQFARYLPQVCERVKDVFIGAGPEISAVLKTVKGSFTCYERWELIPSFDFQITLSSLPLVFGTTVDTIPASVPYLSADAAKTAAWRTRLERAALGRKSVGFVWQGRPTHPNDRVRSVALGHLSRLIELDDILPVSLQVGEGREQLAQHPLKSRVLDAGGELKDFSDTAALISSLDCVVTIDSAIAHLTGALGRPGFVMLPKVAEWRWLRERGDSPWYPTLELMRQGPDARWDSVVSRLVERLRA
jgi:Tfp pilus assembly protein PilF